jgi:hypothetical protein
VDWNDGPGTVAAVVAVLALVGSFLSFVRSLGAERKAAAAEKRAVQAEQSANDARSRAAAALERANEIAEQTMPSKAPAWEIHYVSGSRYVALNNSPGKGVARKAFIEGVGPRPDLIIPDESEPRDVPAGDALAFLARKVMGPHPVVRVSHEGDDGERVWGDRTIY